MVKKRGKLPTENERATFFSDGNDQYTNALLENFDRGTINYGQLIKVRDNGRIVAKIRTIIFGEMNDFIDTVYVERYNLTLRHGISRLVRKSLCFSKCKKMLDNHLDLYQCYNNVIRTNSALTIKTDKGTRDIERTPCMAFNLKNTERYWETNPLLLQNDLLSLNLITEKAFIPSIARNEFQCYIHYVDTHAVGNIFSSGEFVVHSEIL